MPFSRCRSPLATSILTASLLLGGLVSLPMQAAHAAAVQPGQAQKQLAKLATAFHEARCKFDPLLFATANGDSRYNDQIGMSISPSDASPTSTAPSRRLPSSLTTIFL